MAFAICILASATLVLESANLLWETATDSIDFVNSVIALQSFAEFSAYIFADTFNLSNVFARK